MNLASFSTHVLLVLQEHNQDPTFGHSMSPGVLPSATVPKLCPVCWDLDIQEECRSVTWLLISQPRLCGSPHTHPDMAFVSGDHSADFCNDVCSWVQWLCKVILPPTPCLVHRGLRRETLRLRQMSFLLKPPRDSSIPQLTLPAVPSAVFA